MHKHDFQGQYRIDQEKKERTGRLDLGYTALSEFPLDVWLEMPWLEELHLSNSRWGKHPGERINAEAYFENWMTDPEEIAYWRSKRSYQEYSWSSIPVFPDCIPNLPKLRVLTVDGELVIGEGNEVSLWQLGAMPVLEHLELWNLNVTDLSPLQALKRLRKLRLEHLPCQDTHPLQELTELRWLSLAFSQIADLAPLADLKQLEFLNLDRCPVNHLEPLANLSALQSLNLSRTRLEDPGSLRKCRELKRLYLYSSKWEGGDLEFVRGMKQLRHLDLHGSEVRDVSALADANQLEYLNISRTRVIDLEPIGQLKRLRHLDISNVPGIIDLELFSLLENLEHLSCCDNEIYLLDGIESMKKLRELDLECTTLVSLDGLEGLKELRWLDISETQVVNLKPVLHLIRNPEIELQVGSEWDIGKEMNNGTLCSLVGLEILQEPPLDVVQQGRKAILEYFEQRKK